MIDFSRKDFVQNQGTQHPDCDLWPFYALQAFHPQAKV